jgi:hypothetical protein
MGWHGPVTHRQYCVWQYWLASEWNQPDRSDHYLMQIAFAILRVNAKHPSKVRMQDQKIEFVIGGQSKSAPNIPTNPTSLAAQAKAIWASRMTAPITIVESKEVVDG